MAFEQGASGGQSASTSSAAEVRRREMILLLILASVQFTSIVDFMVVMPLGPQLQRKLQIDNAQFGWIVASYTIAAGLAGLLASSIMDRFGRKSAFLTLYTGFLLGTLFCGLAAGYSMLLAARALTGAFGGILGGMALAIVGDVFPEERRGRATGILMSAFAVATVVGVPSGIYLGGELGWHVPFLVLAALGLPVLFVAVRVLPPLRDHLHQTSHSHPLAQIVETFGHSNHIRAFALTVAVMLGSFSIIPSTSLYLVSNVGLDETKDLPWVFFTGGVLTLVGAPLIGRVADRHGKLRVYRVVATMAIVMIFVVTNLPRVPLAVAAGAYGLFMLTNAGRMVTAMTMITGSVERRLRGGFMSANSAVQHLASGLAAAIGGLILVKGADGRQQHFNRIGLFAAVLTALSLWLAGRVRSAQAVEPPLHGGSEDTTLPPELTESTLDYPADAVATEPM